MVQALVGTPGDLVYHHQEILYSYGTSNRDEVYHL